MVGADHELRGDRVPVRTGGQVGDIPLVPARVVTLASSSRLTLLVLLSSWVNRFRFTGALPATVGLASLVIYDPPGATLTDHPAWPFVQVSSCSEPDDLV